MGARGRVIAGLRAAARAFANPSLARVEIAWALSVTGDLAATVALTVYAFQVGGAPAVGLAALIRLLPSALAAPFMALPGDRHPRERVLLLVEASRGLLVIVAGFAAALDGAPLAVYLTLGIAAVVSSALRSTQFALIPSLASTPEELVAANVGLASIEGLGNLVGPAVAGLLLLAVDPSVVLAIAGATFVVAAVVLWGVRAPSRLIPSSTGGVWSQAVGGLRAIAGDGPTRLVVGAFLVQTVVRGALGVFVVVMALEVLGLGQDSIGYLAAALGVGGIIGAVLTLSLVGRPRLAVWFALGLVLWGVPSLAFALGGAAVVAFLGMAIAGIANSLVDVAGMTMLQRIVDDRVLTRVLGVLDGVVLAGAAAGAALAPLLLDTLGREQAFLVVGLVLPLLVAIAWRPLGRADQVAALPSHLLERLRGVPMLAALDVPSIDLLARRAIPLEVPDGTAVITEGDHGDRFYVIDDGSVEVTKGGRLVATLGPGDHFGEIALLRDVPRTATVTARGLARVVAVERDDFLRVVTGFALSAEEAHRVAQTRLDELDTPDGEAEALR